MTVQLPIFNEMYVVDRLLDASSGTFGVRLALPNPTGALPAGIRCRVEFPQLRSAQQGGPGSAKAAMFMNRSLAGSNLPPLYSNGF